MRIARGLVAGDNVRLDLAGEVTAWSSAFERVAVAAWGEVEEVPFRCTGPCTTSTSLPLTVALAELATPPLAALGELAVAVAAVKAGDGLDAVGLTSIPSAFPVETTDVVVFTAAGFLDLTSALHSFRNRSSSSSPTGPSSCSRSRCSSSSLEVCSEDGTDMLASVKPEMPYANYVQISQSSRPS